MKQDNEDIEFEQEEQPDDSPKLRRQHSIEKLGNAISSSLTATGGRIMESVG